MDDAQDEARTPPTTETETETKTETETETAAATCMICGEQKTEGIHILYGFICEPCELEIVRTDVMDAKYPFFVNQLKQIFYKKDA